MREKKEWQNPELIVLVRSKPEEAVLSTCKGAVGVSGAGVQIGDCFADDPTGGGCLMGPCSGRAPS